MWREDTLNTATFIIGNFPLILAVLDTSTSGFLPKITKIHVDRTSVFHLQSQVKAAGKNTHRTGPWSSDADDDRTSDWQRQAQALACVTTDTMMGSRGTQTNNLPTLNYLQYFLCVTLNLCDTNSCSRGQHTWDVCFFVWQMSTCFCCVYIWSLARFSLTTSTCDLTSDANFISVTSTCQPCVSTEKHSIDSEELNTSNGLVDVQ